MDWIEGHYISLTFQHILFIMKEHKQKIHCPIKSGDFVIWNTYYYKATLFNQVIKTISYELQAITKWNIVQ